LNSFSGIFLAGVAKLPAHDYIKGILHPWTGGHTESLCQSFAIKNGLERVCVEKIQFLGILEEV
jgi:hypothetical protein